MANASAIRAGNAFVQLGADDGPLQKTLAAGALKLQSWGKAIQDLGLSITMPLERLGGMAAERGREMLRLAEETGTSVEEISALGFAAQRSGGSMEGMENALTHVNRVVADAAAGATGANEHLQRLNLTFDDLAHLGTTERFMLIADRLSQIQDRGIRAGTAVAILGRRGRELIPMFSGGAAGIRSLMDQAQRMGRVITTREAQEAKAFGFELDAIAQAFKTSAMIVAGGLLPGLREAFAGDKDIASMIVGIARGTRDWLQRNEKLVATVFNIGLYMGYVGAALIVVGKILPAIAAMLRINTMLSIAWGAALWLTNPYILAFVAGAGLGALAVYGILSAANLLPLVFERLGQAVGTLVSDWTGAIAGIKDALQEGDIEGAWNIVVAALQLSWARFVATGEATWINLRAALGDFWTYSVAGFRLMGNRIVSVWDDVWARVASGARMVWGDISGFIQRAMIRARFAFDQAAQTAALEAQRREQTQQERAERQALQRRIMEINDRRDNGQDQIAQDARNEIQQRERQRRADLAGVDDRVRQAQANLDHAINGRVHIGNAVNFENPDAMEDRLRNMSAVSTFMTGALSGLVPGHAGQTAMERAADAAEAANDLQREEIRLLDDIRELFGMRRRDLPAWD